MSWRNAGADINARSTTGWTPMHAAAHWGPWTVIKILLSYGAELEAVANHGETPLRVAIAFRDGQQIRELLKYGASLENAKKSDYLSKNFEDAMKDERVKRVIAEELAKAGV